MIFTAMIEQPSLGYAVEIVPDVVALAAAHLMSLMYGAVPELLVRVCAVMLFGSAGGEQEQGYEAELRHFFSLSIRALTAQTTVLPAISTAAKAGLSAMP